MRKAFFLLLLLSAVSADAGAFRVPERLQYDLTWAGIRAGEATLETTRNGADIVITSRAVSARWVSVFYHVEDMAVSTLKEGRINVNGRTFGAVPSSHRLRVKEGRHRRDKETLFDTPARKVTFINHIEKETVTLDMADVTLDPLAAFFFVRYLPLEVGRSVYVDISDSKKLYRAEVQVLRRETVTTHLGTFSTLVIKPLLQSEGIFVRKGDVTIWLTDDERRLPVILTTKVVVGSVKATLLKAP